MIRGPYRQVVESLVTPSPCICKRDVHISMLLSEKYQ